MNIIFEKQCLASHNKIENVLEEIRKTWENSPVRVNNFRNFSHFYPKLTVTNLMLCEYANSENKNDKNVLTTVYNYILHIIIYYNIYI